MPTPTSASPPRCTLRPSYAPRSAPDTLARGHARVRNLRGGFSRLTDQVPPNLRLATAWAQLTRAL